MMPALDKLEIVRRVVAESGDADARNAWREIEQLVFMDVTFPADEYESPRQRGLVARDYYLRCAYAEIEGAKRRQRILSLRKKIKLFRSTTWTNVDRKRPPPERLTPLQKQLFFAFQIASEHALTVPESRSRLYSVMSYETENDWTNNLL